MLRRDSLRGKRLAFRQKNNLCWLCGRTGHKARECYSLGKKPYYARGIEGEPLEEEMKGDEELFEFVSALSPEDLEDFILDCESGYIWQDEEDTNQGDEALVESVTL